MEMYINILSKMTQEGADYADVLKDAQALGYAEANPVADVEGYDSSYKLSILSSLAFNKRLPVELIEREGITKITAEDFKYAKKLGARIKIFGTSSNTKDGISAMVAPYMILFLIFTVFPVILSIIISFTNFNMLEMPDFVLK